VERFTFDTLAKLPNCNNRSGIATGATKENPSQRRTRYHKNPKKAAF